MPEQIEIRGARENTLADVDVDLPKRAITVVTGVSGSGKSSLVFDTLAAAPGCGSCSRGSGTRSRATRMCSRSMIRQKGMCEQCQGLGVESAADEAALVDESLSLDDGALRFATFAVGSWYWKSYAFSGFFDVAKPIADYSERERWLFLHARRARSRRRASTPWAPTRGSSRASSASSCTRIPRR